MADATHRFLEPPLWRRFLGQDGCQVCGLPRDDAVHPVTLEPALNDLRAASRRIREAHDYTLMSQAEMWGRVREFTHGAQVHYPLRQPYDNLYRTVDHATFISMMIDHWASVSRSEVDFFDCDLQASYARVFFALLGITATAHIIDYSSSHAYTLVILTDRERLYDAGSGTFPDRGQAPKFRMTDIEVTF